MKLWNQYHLPETIDAAMNLLHVHVGNARLIAGGTDLLLDIQQGRHPPVDTLVDITAIPELRTIEVKDEEIHLGSGVTHSMILESQLLRHNAMCLTQACAGIGGSQVRNVATIGGNVAHALPAGDGSIALLALDAEAEIISHEGARWVTMEALFKGPGVPSFDPRVELLASFRFKLRKDNQRTAFHRVMRPQGVAIAILNMAIWVQNDNAGMIEDVRISVGPAGPVPFRELRTSKHRATEEYRSHLLGYLLKEVTKEVHET
jgi:carbon-monoxide dehydrogenase medium subunit